MPDNDADDIERRHADEAPDDSDSGPVSYTHLRAHET